MVTFPNNREFFSRLRAAYKGASPDDKNTLKTLILYAALCLILSVLSKICLPTNSYVQTASETLLALAIPLAVAAAERLNILMPVEHRIKNLLDGASAEVKAISKILSDNQRVIGKDLTHIISSLDSYLDYNSAKINFGFNKMIGINLEVDSSNGGYIPRIQVRSA